MQNTCYCVKYWACPRRQQVTIFRSIRLSGSYWPTTILHETKRPALFPKVEWTFGWPRLNHLSSLYVHGFMNANCLPPWNFCWFLDSSKTKEWTVLILSLVHCLSVKGWVIIENSFLIPFLIPETIGIQTLLEFRKTFSITVWILLFIIAGTYMNCNLPLTYIMTTCIYVWREHPKSLHCFTFYCKHLYSASKGTIIHSKLIFIQTHNRCK